MQLPRRCAWQALFASFFGVWCLIRAPWADAAITVAAADSLPQERAHADLVCDGVDDQQELAKSLALAPRGKTAIDVNPKTQRTIESAVNHVVEWLPGNYQLSSTLEIPDAVNCVINAEGTTLHNQTPDRDGVVIRGMNRCRYRFGTIESQSTGAALRIQPTDKMPALMSFVDFAGLVGKNLSGTGLLVDPTHENVCVNRFVGTDVIGFDKGVVVGARVAAKGRVPPRASATQIGFGSATCGCARRASRKAPRALTAAFGR